MLKWNQADLHVLCAPKVTSWPRSKFYASGYLILCMGKELVSGWDAPCNLHACQVGHVCCGEQAGQAAAIPPPTAEAGAQGQGRGMSASGVRRSKVQLEYGITSGTTMSA